MSKLRRRAALTFAVMTVASAVAAAPASASTTATVKLGHAREDLRDHGDLRPRLLAACRARAQSARLRGPSCR